MPRAIVILILTLLAARVAADPGSQTDTQNLLVLTQSRDAAGRPAALYLQAVSTSLRQYVPAPVTLVGQSPIRDLQLSPNGRFAFLIARHRAGPAFAGPLQRQTSLNVIQTNPLDNLYVTDGFYDPDWEMAQLIAGPPDPSGETTLILLEYRDSAPFGRVSRVHIRSANESIALERTQTDLVPGHPVAVAVDWKAQRVYALTSGPSEGNPRIVVLDQQPKARRVYTLDGPNAQPALGIRPIDLAYDAIHGRLFAMAAAYDLSRPSGPAQSRIFMLHADGHTAYAPPLELPGVATPDRATLAWTPPNVLWGTTQTAGSAFAYASGISILDDGWRKTRESAFTRAFTPPRVAGEPHGARTAVAGQNRLEIWPAEGASPATRQLDVPPDALAWLPAGLFMGQAGVLSCLNPGTGESLWSISFNSGSVVRIAPLPPPRPSARDVDADGLLPAAEHDLRTLRENPDSDRDGIPDGLDPEPTRPSSRLVAPDRIDLDLRTRGRQQRTFEFDVPPGATWHARYDRRKAPWLVVEEVPRDGTRAALTFRLSDRARAAVPGAVQHATVRISLEPGDDGLRIAGNPHVVHVSFSAPDVPAALIDWQLAELPGAQHPPAQDAYESLRRLLAAPPSHYSHELRASPLLEPPRNAAAVVLDLRAAQQGALTRQVLLDYVAAGGGLLIVGRHLPEADASGLARWLEPLGIRIEPAEAVSGAFPLNAGQPLAHYLEELQIRNGCRIVVASPVDVAAPAGKNGAAALALRHYGFGRLALLAGSTPLEDAALRRTDTRRFARALFHWLAGEDDTILDQDFDGLPDYIEDANGNGRADLSETDYLRADTDGDGLPDGVEDANFNGRVDEFETNPRVADSDGDGVVDGADPVPLPIVATPIVTALSPPTGPAEGGTLVEIAGRNLPPDPEVWFGGLRSTHVLRPASDHLLATAPPLPKGQNPGPLSVRVANPQGQTEAVLSDAYVYRGPTSVRLTLDALDGIRRQYDGYHGAFRVSLDVPDVNIANVRCFIRVNPDDALTELEALTSEDLGALGRALRVRDLGGGLYRVAATPGDAITRPIELGLLQWRAAQMPTPADRIQLRVLFPALSVRWGGFVDVPPQDLTLDLTRATPATALR